MDVPAVPFVGMALASVRITALNVSLRNAPMRYVEPGKSLPPFLILHGTGDPVVNYSQSERLFRKLTDCGYDATMYQVPDAPHEGSFWSAARRRWRARWQAT